MTSNKELNMSTSNNILLTGFWSPTNEMLRPFSQNPQSNPAGWVGGNWRGRGYDIHAYFPEFPEGTFPVGVGDFQVDYQATSECWWRIVQEIRPCALITFSRGFPGNSWEVETQQRNLSVWRNDYLEPFQPTPAPPDDSVPPETIRYSSLPKEEIVQRVNDADLGIEAYIDEVDFVGAFVSEFIAYHGVWYQSLHANPEEDDHCFAAGHIHVGIDIPVGQAILATEITLETLIDSLGDIVE